MGEVNTHWQGMAVNTNAYIADFDKDGEMDKVTIESSDSGKGSDCCFNCASGARVVLYKGRGTEINKFGVEEYSFKKKSITLFDTNVDLKLSALLKNHELIGFCISGIKDYNSDGYPDIELSMRFFNRGADEKAEGTDIEFKMILINPYVPKKGSGVK